MRKLDNKSCDGLRLRVKADSKENLKKTVGKIPDCSVVYEAKGTKCCTQVPSTCIRKRLVLDFHSFV